MRLSRCLMLLTHCVVHIVSTSYSIYNLLIAILYYYIIIGLFAERRSLGEHFNSLCDILPLNYKQSISKLRTIPHLLNDEGKQLSKLITSSSVNVRKINKKIITYLVVKSCYNGSSTILIRLCDIMDELLDPTSTPTCVQQIRCGMYVHNYTMYVCMFVIPYDSKFLYYNIIGRSLIFL